MKRFRKQNYGRIKKSCREHHRLFTDSEFPPNLGSLWYDAPRLPDIEWTRIGALCHDPRFVENGIPSETRIVQGSIGDCWFMAALTALARQQKLWKRIIPDPSEQEWDPRRPGAYRGTFHFRFWHFGKWYDIVVDDFLPTRNDRLVFARSPSDNEFWCALLEKAYAKFHGCYERLISGSLAEALVDITGGVPENISLSNALLKLPEQRKYLRKTLRNALESKALVLAAVHSKSEMEIEKETAMGLLKGHAYSVIAIRTLTLDKACKTSGLRNFFKNAFKEKDTVDLVRLRNPWGRKEWTGPWSEGSIEWRKVGSLQKYRTTSIFKESSGEFWMTFDDFLNNFACVTICHLNLRSTHKEHAFCGAWTRGTGDIATLRAGGSINDKTFLCNPQYLLKLGKVRGARNSVVISLLQSHAAINGNEPENRRRESVHSIGVTVIRVEENRKCRLHELRGLDVVAMNDFVNCRSNFLRLQNLPEGNYVIIPSMYIADEEGDYYLRVYTNSSATVQHLSHDAPKLVTSSCCLFQKPYTMVTRVKVLYGKDLEGSHLNGYFVRLIAEKEQCQSQVIRNTTEPHWNWATLIYRRSTSPLILQLWTEGSSCLGFADQMLMGEATVDVLADGKFWQYTTTVADSKRSSVGTIALTVISSENCIFGI